MTANVLRGGHLDRAVDVADRLSPAPVRCFDKERCCRSRYRLAIGGLLCLALAIGGAAS